MTGDDIYVDIEGAQNAGIPVKTGKFRPADLTRNIKPESMVY
jgi:ribonucleotide monophosphatase NagD (HAD superfamily)